jgi:uncharacterized membrane protein
MIPVPDPLHPAVVHLPMALAVLVPLAAVGALLAIGTRFVPPRAWAAVVLLQALLLASGVLALETGEAEEERVEEVVAERFIEAHAEAAERFVWAAGLGLLVMGAGLLGGRAGRIGRVAGLVASLAVLLAGVQVGHLGGALVYEHGAAAAYAGPAPPARGHDDD